MANMLKLTNIHKSYQAGDNTVEALKGIDLAFRESEFVSILGPSGCGKTTLLNIIGGLDQYSSGDLVINGRSTKNFRDSDWDAYRNHSIGFVFQSYNLIPHQSVLSNVELALTLSGVSKSERRERAKKVLEQVGLGDQMYKKPNQMSGGQMQRVAIARALINDPDILLADEPTGALDSETSVQIMEILREISKDKLIIMVTHNPDLAETYSSRIIRLLDGRVTGDSMPFEPETTSAPAPEKKKQRRPSMSLFTALSLSLNNLMTKKGRTFLTAFAGSIGIIGIALILSLSNGIQTYIDRVQEDTLSSYPITIEAESMDMSSLVTSLMGVHGEAEDSGTHKLDAVYSNTIMYDLLNSLTSMESETNNLTAFKEYLESGNSIVKDYTSAIQYSYELDMNIYAKDAEGTIFKSDVIDLLETCMSAMYGGDYSSYFATYGSDYSQMEVWEEMLPPQDGDDGLINEILTEQYDVIYGSWPQNYDEAVLIVNKNNEISDLVIYCLGLGEQSRVVEAMQNVMNGGELDTFDESWSYEDICNMTFKVVLPAEYYRHDSATGAYTDIIGTDAGMDYLYNSEDIGTTVKIVGILRPNENAVSSMMSGAIGYTAALTDYLLEKSQNMDILKAQKDSPDTDVISGLPFLTDDYYVSDEQKAADITAYIETLSDSEKASIYTAVMSEPSEEYVNALIEQQMSQMTREYIETMVVQSYAEEMGVDEETVSSYIAQMDDETLFSYVEEAMREQIREEYAAGVQEQVGQMTTDQLAAALDYGELTIDQYVFMYDSFMPPAVSDSTYEENLKLLGDVDYASPKTINIYAATFEDKDLIADEIEKYNDSVDEEDQISYTDYVALLMGSITTIINAISYVLIAFVAISLIVSSIMIGIITYISVLERTKEIGILRSIGASKRDISRVFNAETLIVGFVSGALGIGVTLLLLIPINIIVHHLTDIMSLNAVLPAAGAAILVIISMLLTFIAGLIPSRLAAKKDPVVALRTE